MKTYFKKLISNGGPDIKDYPRLTKIFKDIFKKIGRNNKNHPLLKEIYQILWPTLTCNTMQGFAYRKPHGYCGDFEIIDRIYKKWVSPFSKLRRWDHYFHAQHASEAVRNRKNYFIKLLLRLEATYSNINPRVLNIVSSPARDIREYFELSPEKKIEFECIDFNQDAIDYAKKVCLSYLFKIHFHKSDIIQYQPSGKYHLIWSSGLFDYFSDRLFVKFIKRLSHYLESGGELVIGSFSTHNPSRAYLECVGRWFLEHRTGEKLIALAKEAGIHPFNICVKKEPPGVNYFLHIKR